MSTKWDEIYGSISESLKKLPRFKGDIVTEKEFTNFIEKFETHISSYESIWMSGFFDNSYARIIEKYYHTNHNCDVKALSLGFRKDARGQQNAKALEKMENNGVDVRINENLHARMYIAYNYQTDTMILFLGSFDYTKECMSGARRDIGMSTHNPDLILRARTFFIDVFTSTDSKTLADYKREKQFPS